MALFEYQCKNEHLTEKLYFGSEVIPEKIECPECGENAKKIISAAAFTVPVGSCGNAETGYSGDYRNVKPMDQKRAKSRAESEAHNLNHGRNPR